MKQSGENKECLGFFFNYECGVLKYEYDYAYFVILDMRSSDELEAVDLIIYNTSSTFT